MATIAHELGLVRLLGECRIHPGYEEHEPLTDLTTVFLGMGVFTGNAAFCFTQFTGGFSEGWQAQRRGYLTEEMFGYALALFAWVRGENKPGWAKHLKGNVSAYFKSAHKLLEKTGDTQLKTLSGLSNSTLSLKSRLRRHSGVERRTKPTRRLVLSLKRNFRIFIGEKNYG